MKHLILMIYIISLSACNGKQEKVRPVLEKITESVYASGYVKSNHQYEVFSSVSGIVKRRLVKEGMTISKDDPIIELSGVTARLQAESAHIIADNAAHAANFRKLEALRIDIEEAKNKLDQDALRMQRQQRLWDQQIGSRTELEQRELTWKTSKNNYENACLQYAELQREIGFREKQALKNLEISRSVANDYTIRSQYNGKLYDLLVEEGEMVNTQQPVAVVGDAVSFLLELQVDEYDIARIKTGQKVLISMDSYRGQIFEGVITKVVPFMHERSKTFTVEAQFLRPPAILYPNLTCESNIIVAEKAQTLTIPRACLMDGNTVLMADMKRRAVVTGLMDYQKVEILGGLTFNDVIIKPAP